MTAHSWSSSGSSPHSPGILTCLRCGAVTNNAFLASIHSCKVPAMTNQEDAPLPVSSHSEENEAMLIRQRRLTRRAYARSYSSDDAHPLPAPNKDNAMFACKYCNKPSNHRYYAAYVGEYGEFSCADCYKAGKCVPGNGRPLPGFEPVLEQSGFAPLPDAPLCTTCGQPFREGEMTICSNPFHLTPPTRYWTGFAHGFCVALGGVLVLTGLLLWKGLP